MSLPTLPVLEGDFALEVFTHESIQREGLADHLLYGDKRRLFFMGQFALRHAVTLAYFRSKPLLTEDQIKFHCNKFFSNTNVEKWVDHYKFIRRIRCKPEVVPSLNNAKERLMTLACFAGAYVPNTQKTRQSEDEEDGGESEVEEDNTIVLRPAKQSRIDSDIVDTSPSTGIVSLASFNEYVQRQGINTAFEFSTQGPAHALTWHATCIVNGQAQGQGTGNTKQAAKEEAVTRTYPHVDNVTYLNWQRHVEC
ncbi:hypothetical protein PILCRDRAFT_6897 [Piloderma croceum F 1598]|uniref:DRBM domain-containing protein n=1 Tax=Piloderma croceum (strain F 1598) TaxID=765440 RepID=A0A0C3C3A5_PILCF|nr:hypothetical protein PILCRDRAFT_6897 [Piloderma croceum F 1598]